MLLVLYVIPRDACSLLPLRPQPDVCISATSENSSPHSLGFQAEKSKLGFPIIFILDMRIVNLFVNPTQNL
jgi:hypothetical protein